MSSVLLSFLDSIYYMYCVLGTSCGLDVTLLHNFTDSGSEENGSKLGDHILHAK